MDSFLEKFMLSDDDLTPIEVLNIITAPGYMIARDLTQLNLPNSSYIQLEHMMFNYWEHGVPSFNVIPGSGHLVMATDDTKRTFKRGIIIKVEQSFDGVNSYYVFLYDWGLIERFKFGQICKLSPEFQNKLPPRSFLLILAGVVRFEEKWERFRQLRVTLEEERRKMHLKCRTDHGYKEESETLHFMRHWLRYRQVKLRSFKSFYDVIHYGELLGYNLKLSVNQTKNPELLADEMEKQGLTVLSPVLIKMETQTDPSSQDAYNLSDRLNFIKCSEYYEKRKKAEEKAEN